MLHDAMFNFRSKISDLLRFYKAGDYVSDKNKQAALLSITTLCDILADIPDPRFVSKQ